MGQPASHRHTSPARSPGLSLQDACPVPAAELPGKTPTTSVTRVEPEMDAPVGLPLGACGACGKCAGAGVRQSE